jgi:PAS domain S-box-containing protein
MFNNMRLWNKILFGIAGLVLLMGLSMIIFAKTVLYENLLVKLEKKGISIARHLATNSINPILTEKYFEVEMLIKDYMKNEDDIEYIFILGRNGNLLAHTFDKGFPSGLRNVNRDILKQESVTQRLITEKGYLLDIAVPLMKGNAGVVHLGFSEKQIREDINSMVTWILWWILALTIIGIGIAFFLARMIAKPVTELARVAEAVGRGDLDQKVNLQSDDEIGQLGKSFNAMIDMRKQTEEAVRAGNQKLYDITSHLAEGIYALNELGHVTFMNPEAERLLGWTMEELNEKGPHDLIHFQKPDGTPLSITDCKIHNVIKANKRYLSRDELFVRKDGTVFPVSVISAPMNIDKQIIASVTAFSDITQEKKLEAELLKAQKLESVGILAGGIAHDFNNLLQGIMGNISLSKLFLDKHAPEKAYPFLEEAEKASEAAKELSFRLLTFSKGGDPFKKICAIESVLRKASGLSLSGSDVTCDIALSDDLYPVDIDEEQMTQVFSNILRNAKEAMPDGGTISISAGNVLISEDGPLPLKAGDYVRISIKDRGIGIPEEDLSRIFDPYFSTKELGSQKGSGLGLSICHSIIRKHEGDIQVESRKGTGTTFHIYIPASIQKRGTVQQAVSKKRLLFMDDDERIIELVTNMMEHLGYDVECARNGEKAIEIYRQAKETGKTFDAVILDLTVQGGMGGDQAVKKLLELDPGVKAVISSGYIDDPILTDCRKYGFVSSIAKPYKMEQLKELLEKM